MPTVVTKDGRIQFSLLPPQLVGPAGCEFAEGELRRFVAMMRLCAVLLLAGSGVALVSVAARHFWPEVPLGFARWTGVALLGCCLPLVATALVIGVFLAGRRSLRVERDNIEAASVYSTELDLLFSLFFLWGSTILLVVSFGGPITPEVVIFGRATAALGIAGATVIKAPIIRQWLMYSRRRLPHTP